jgi:REP element-mobilizing transposase RayT
VLFGQIRRHLGCISRACQAKECKIEEGDPMPDHVHMLISIPPKYSVAEVIGYLKGKARLISRGRSQVLHILGPADSTLNLRIAGERDIDEPATLERAISW